MDALIAEMRRALRTELEAVHVRIDEIQERRTQEGSVRREREPQHQQQQRDVEAETYYSRGSLASRRDHRRPRRVREERGRQNDNLGGLKLKIPPFYGKNDPDAYLEWEKKIELVFDCQHYNELNKVRVAATEFYDYALSWWDQLVTTRRRNGDYPVETWRELKAVMRKRFVPSHYHRELHQKIRRLNQGSRSVEDYYQEMETLMIKADISEDREATMARFLGGLNREIQDRLEMQQYEDLEEMLHKAILVEQQVKRKVYTKPSYGAGTSANKPSYQREGKQVAKVESKPSTAPLDSKGKAESNPTRTRDVKCFRCQGRGHYANECSNKKIMVLMENGDIESEEEQEVDSEAESEHIEPPARGELLVSRRTLSVQSKGQEQMQRENLFHSRCHVQGKVCSMIIDGGSCTNVASETMVSKLGLELSIHPRPYKLHWLNECGEMKVNHQVKVPIRIGKYEDEILCDVLPMEAGHILLGRPWQFDRRVIHDGYKNQYSFEHKGKKITLIPMTPQEVYQDQLVLEQRRESMIQDSHGLMHLWSNDG